MLILLLACSRHTSTLPDDPEPTVADSVAFYASQPEMLRPFPATAVPHGLPDLEASTCGGCHVEIYNEWRISTHARAWEDDAQFMAELHKSTQPDNDVGWMCVNCHTPVANQLPRLVAGLEDGALNKPIYVDNPLYDADLQREAITCAACHVRDGVVLGPYGDTAAPHATRKDPGLLSEEVCTQCHQATAHFEELNLACMFNTGAELAESDYAEQGYRCQSCHMPEIERPLMAGMPSRPTRRHWFGGSLLPKHPDFADELAPLAEHYPPGMVLSWSTLPEALSADAPATVTLRYQNANAGHRLPSGDPERYIIVRAQALSADGTVLAGVEERIGSIYQWYPEIELLSDNRMAPHEARTLDLSFRPPAGAVTLSVRASRWRLTEENVAYHNLEGEVVAGAVFFEETQTLTAR
jgi:hypothetical protein